VGRTFFSAAFVFFGCPAPTSTTLFIPRPALFIAGRRTSRAASPPSPRHNCSPGRGSRLQPTAQAVGHKSKNPTPARAPSLAWVPVPSRSLRTGGRLRASSHPATVSFRLSRSARDGAWRNLLLPVWGGHSCPPTLRDVGITTALTTLSFRGEQRRGICFCKRRKTRDGITRLVSGHGLSHAAQDPSSITPRKGAAKRQRVPHRPEIFRRPDGARLIVNHFSHKLHP
jgi:hypothetical protein